MSALVLVYNIPSSGFSLTLPISTDGSLTSVDWGDTPLVIDSNYSHTYTTSGIVTISITGTGITQLAQNISYSGSAYLTECTSFGEIGLTNLTYAFNSCSNLIIVPSSLPTSSTVTNTSYMFQNAYNFNQDISGWDVSSVTNMSSMFQDATSFNQDISGWDVSAVTNMSSMFAGASAFNQDISGWDVSAVTNMSYMFYGASAFNNGGVTLTWGTNTGTGGVTDMSYMFRGASAFNQNISGWDVSAVENMSNMFEYATSFNQDLSNWAVSAVTSMYYMFADAHAFNNGGVALNWGTDTSLVENMAGMFYHYSPGTSSFNQNISSWNVSNVTNMGGMFNNATVFNNGGVALTWTLHTTSDVDLNSMFSNASAFNQDISGWTVSSVTDMNNMFQNATSFNQDISGWDVSDVTNMSGMFQNATSFNQDISGWDVSAVTYMSGMFQDATAFNNGDTSGSSTKPLSWDSNTSLVTDMSYMFYNAISFNQDISGWDVSDVTNMSGMFQNALSFNQDIIGWTVSSVTDMSGMFIIATSFNQDISGWDVSAVTNMIGMFYGASAFNNGDTSGSSTKPLSWDSNTSLVTDMSYMFNNASSFNQDISGWDVSSVENMFNMFNNASSFNQDMSNWDVSSVTTMNSMFLNTALSTENYNSILNDWSLLTLQLGVASNFLGLVYSPSGATAHDYITTNYNWDLTGDAYVSKDNLAKWTLFNLTINRVDLLGFVNGNQYQLYYSGFPFSSTITYSSPATTVTFTDLRFITSYSNSGNVSLVLKNNTSDTDIATYRFTVSGLVCFKEDTKILTNHGYIPIQHLRKGDLIQTLKDGFKPIYMIGKREIHHAAIEDRIKDQLYVCTKENYPDIMEDLVITGCHSILVKSFKDDEQKEKAANLQNGKIYVTDDHYRLPACLDDKASVYEPAGIYTIYHLALDHDNYYMNYGIFANGLLVESCTKNYLERLSRMTIIE